MTQYVTAATLTDKLDWLKQSPKRGGQVTAITIRPAANQRESLQRAMFSPEQGAHGDNWVSDCKFKLDDGRSDPGYQIAIMNSRMAELLSPDADYRRLAGDQLFVDLDLSQDNLQTGDQLQVGDAILEVTPIPHNGCRKFKERFGLDALKFLSSKDGQHLRLRGIYVQVLTAGYISVGDNIIKL